MSDVYESVRRKVREIFAALPGADVERLAATDFHRNPLQAALARDFGPERSKQIAFHLTDWGDDAAFLVAVRLYPDRFTDDEIEAGVMAALAHAPNHLAAAAKVAEIPVTDVFGVGALNGGGEGQASS